ncbi:dihydrolipoyl dehydrogenase family protein [Sulfurimonas autotrophica]|uniref:FAD-dependent pyridine nucleotide-disulfide oxidoreductase n=1 Tax=Sulfurimonas autotrophica (strain ATCC BAA-671 / DSM 16294 / JCM 11897 / OK10) TaxID=563040 RepID=E0UP71_SULAO|nr:NAD(P)/FAD-dependent oxidoreductase [Sulfurimonas autotrophica]ADN08535.1 FAD-dependent pyridine nucleotide-disulfide oxidoreductase [Sulfurimonas autotrophica DSM 16294]
MYDIIFIGGGLNYAGAIVAAKNGKKVALIEKDMKQLGGVCLHKGCIPSKMFLHYANVVYESKSDILEGEAVLCMQKLFHKKTNLIENAWHAITKQCSHVDLIEGEAKLKEPHKVEINGEILEAEHIVMGTGSHSFVPEGIEYNTKDIIVSDEVLMMQELPKKIAIYGVGAIGLEMASFFATAGVEVTLINHSGKILKQSNPLIQKEIKNQLEKIGVKILENHGIKTAKSTKKGVHITFEDKSSIYIPVLLVAAGRRPNVDFLTCKDIKVEKGIVTDRFFETTLAKHYAIGDCNGKLQLAHAARAEVLNVTERILGKNPRPLNLDHVVKFIHILPMSYAVVGKTDGEKSGVVPLSQFPYSAYNHASAGLMISYTDNNGFIVGAEILAPNAEELAAIVGMSLAGEMDAAQAKRTIFGHPTFSEALERTFYKL